MPQVTPSLIRSQLEAQVVGHALNNREYLEQLLADPKRLMEQHWGRKLPESLQIHVVQETPHCVILTLPYTGAEGDDELSDEDLEQVAGGKGGGNTIFCPPVAAYGAMVSKNSFHM